MVRQTISIRRLGPEDATAYRTVRLECLKLHPENFSSTYEEQSRLPKLMFETALEEGADDRFLFGAFDGYDLIGICGYVQRNWFGLNAAGTVIQMYVKASYRRRKVGLRLVNAVLHEAFRNAGTRQVTLEVNPANAGAIRLYEQAGFVRLDVERDEAEVDLAGELCMVIDRGRYRCWVTVRQAASEDVPALSALARETYVDAFGHSFQASDLAAHLAAHLSPAGIARMVADDHVLVAEADRRLVGYVQFGPAYPPLSGASDADVELRRLYVHPDFQNRGVGSQLMDAALAHPAVAGAPRVYLDVWVHNPGARRFYERYGFRVIGERSFHIESGAETSPDWIMLRAG